ncbi:hypothetical protein NW768_002766 [Fusarium equiseti]|uniref:Apple domain-containing protein n=1 Tax=Fusarium equiseti TaxID=61235 RepID=A0ABQ8RK98_FUSEQ|nr:hypothetical protein NW768_002766 [Fusarium equiseti]
MSRFSFLAGSVLFAISHVNAGPCRPSPSVSSSSLETATTSIEVVESTATLASTLSTETTASEILSIIVSTTGAFTASGDFITTATTTEAATTTAETTTALATTSAAPVLQPHRDCGSLNTPYTTPNGVAYNIRCNTDFEPATFSLAGVFEDVTNFEECLLRCATSSGCNGVQWDSFNSYCVSMRSFGGTFHTTGNDIAFRVGG